MNRIIICLIFFAGMALFVKGQDTVTETFKVYGNCEMCKTTIESSLGKKKMGVLSANWNTQTKMIIIKFDPAKVSLEEIHKRIAASGYDTEKVRADDATYSGLHKCCQYERAAKEETEK